MQFFHPSPGSLQTLVLKDRRYGDSTAAPTSRPWRLSSQRLPRQGLSPLAAKLQGPLSTENQDKDTAGQLWRLVNGTPFEPLVLGQPIAVG